MPPPPPLRPDAAYVRTENGGETCAGAGQADISNGGINAKRGDRPPWWWLISSFRISYVYVRRCPTLPHRPRCSTIGAGGLNFRVRNGTGCFPTAMTTETFNRTRWTRWVCLVPGRVPGTA